MILSLLPPRPHCLTVLPQAHPWHLVSVSLHCPLLLSLGISWLHSSKKAVCSRVLFPVGYLSAEGGLSWGQSQPSGDWPQPAAAHTYRCHLEGRWRGPLLYLTHPEVQVGPCLGLAATFSVILWILGSLRSPGDLKPPVARPSSHPELSQTARMSQNLPSMGFSLCFGEIGNRVLAVISSLQTC